jgi:hypothetical protein
MMIWREVCLRDIDFIAIVVLNDDLRDSGIYVISKPEICVFTFLDLSNSDFVSLCHV